MSCQVIHFSGLFSTIITIVLINKLAESCICVSYVGALLDPSIDGKQIISKENEDDFYWYFVGFWSDVQFLVADLLVVSTASSLDNKSFKKEGKTQISESIFFWSIPYKS